MWREEGPAPITLFAAVRRVGCAGGDGCLVILVSTADGRVFEKGFTVLEPNGLEFCESPGKAEEVATKYSESSMFRAFFEKA